jgi:glycosyltransferase involved in cell wall biosynthesis
MRIWIFNHYAGTPQLTAGTRHHDLGRELVRRGHSVTIFASAFRHSTRRFEHLGKRQLVRRQRVDGVDFVWIRTTPYAAGTIARAVNMFSYAVLVTLVQVRHERPDVIVGSSVHPFAAWAAQIVARLRRTAYVLEVRDLWPQTLIDLGVIREASIVARALRMLERWLYVSADWIVPVMSGAGTYIAARGGDAARITVIPNGVRLDPPTQERFVGASSLSEDLVAWIGNHSFVAAYVGTMGQANAVDVMLDAAVLLSARGRHDIGMLLIGGGPERERLARAVAEQRLAHVCVAEPVPKSVVPDLLARVDVGLLSIAGMPVLRYGISPNKLFDYLAARLPVLCSVESTDDAVLASGAGIRVEPNNPTSLADALEQVADMPARQRAALGAAGRRYVEQHHDVRILASQFESVLHRASRRGV